VPVPSRPPDLRPRPPHFTPRATLILAGGVLLFFALSFAYGVIPVMLEPIPDGAAQSYVEERVKSRLEGKIPWFLGISIIAAAAIGARLGRR
jgi:hypothetical protein